MFNLVALVIVLGLAATTGPAALLVALATLGFIASKLSGQIGHLKERHPTWVLSSQVLAALTMFSFACLGAGTCARP